MKKVSILLLSLVGGVTLVACNSGGGKGGGISMNISPSTCSISQDTPITFSYSGLTVGESVTSTFALNGVEEYSGTFPADFAEGSFTRPCSDYDVHFSDGNGGPGKYTYDLSQNGQSASATLTVTP